jgi:hypothetical protein
VDTFIDKLADLLRALLGDGESSSRRRSAGGGAGSNSGAGSSGDAEAAFGRNARYDPDLREAWDELDDYMKGGTGGRTSATESRGRERQVDESLRPDYANLEVAFGADIETVRKSYKSLVLKYHPDKHAGDPEKHRVALEITKKIHESFERIRSLQGRS